MMKARVQFFAQLRDLAGVAELDVNLQAGSTIAQLLETIYEQNPALRAHDKSIFVGAGVEFVGRDYVVKDGDAISIMPPVQGG
jgi:molybdopterin converting factor small subunit